MLEQLEQPITGYSKYNPEAKRRTKKNPLKELYPALPNKKYSVIYADPPWDYGGKMQYDKSPKRKFAEVIFLCKTFLFFLVELLLNTTYPL